jgi:hypothetical protein
MTDKSREPAQKPHGPVRLGDPGEHPLSILLFSWMRSTLFFRLLMAVLAGAGALLVALDAVLVRHSYASVEGLPGFFGVFGFLAFGLAVLSGWPLSHLMRRPEDYYEPDDSKGEGGNDR